MTGGRGVRTLLSAGLGISVVVRSRVRSAMTGQECPRSLPRGEVHDGREGSADTLVRRFGDLCSGAFTGEIGNEGGKSAPAPLEAWGT